MTGTWSLLRLVLRRDRFLMPLWIVVLTVAPLGYLSSIEAAYPDAAARQHFYDLNVGSATFAVRNGPLYGPSAGELLAWQCGFIPVVVGLIALLTVVRHTRTEEEAGRRELTGATVVGRHAGLVAAVLAACGAGLVYGLLVALGLSAQGVPVAGALALGLGFTMTGWVFAAVGAVVAQLTWGASGARGIGIGVLVLAFLLRAAGDSSETTGGSAGWLAWLSPIGWAHRLRPFAGSGGGCCCWAWSPRACWWSPRPGCRPAGTSARRCCPRGSGVPRRRRRCARHWHWPGGCNAGRCWSGPCASRWSGC